jgi:SPP1 family predicted phage head-tail adaptor
MRTDRNKKIDIKKPITTQDSYGQPVDDYTPVISSIWASIEPATGRTFYAAEQAQTDVRIKVTIEYCTGITNDMVVFYGTRKLQIASVDDYKEQHRELILMCRELI